LSVFLVRFDCHSEVSMKKKPRVKRPEPPAGRPSPPELFPVPKFGEVVVRLLGEAKTMIQHPGPTRPIACPGEGDCPRSIHKSESRFKAYAPAERWRPDPYGDWLPCVLEITECLWRIMRKHELRGTYWKLWRMASAYSQREVTGELVDTTDASRLRLDVDIDTVVYRVYGTNDIHWGVEPPLDPVEPLPPSTDGPPKIMNGKKAQKEKLEKPENGFSFRAAAEKLARENGMPSPFPDGQFKTL
jgi:hypothetical protein